MLDFTQGRMNIVRAFTDADQEKAASHILTGWNLGKYDPVTLMCSEVTFCDMTSTGYGVGAKHKGKLQYFG